MILYVLYLSKAAKLLLEGHIWVVCKNLKKKKLATSFTEKHNLPLKREHKL